MSDVIDLDLFVTTPKTVQLGGVKYRVPGDMPMTVYLTITHVQQIAEQDDIGPEQERETIQLLVGALIELLTTLPQDAPVDPEKLRTVIMRSSVGKVNEWLSAIYRGDDDEVPADPPTPTEEAPSEPQATAGTTTTSTEPPTPTP